MTRKGSTPVGEQTNPSRCADVLRGTLQGLGLGRVIRHLALLRAWDQVVAPRIRERARVQGFSDGRLYLCVEDPIWLHELHMLRHKLMTMMNQQIGEAVVSEIVLRIGRLPDNAITAMPRPRVERERAVVAGAEPRVKEVLAPLEGLPCHDAFARLLYRWKARRA